jgi:hypothetical protein
VGDAAAVDLPGEQVIRHRQEQCEGHPRDHRPPQQQAEPAGRSEPEQDEGEEQHAVEPRQRGQGRQHAREDRVAAPPAAEIPLEVEHRGEDEGERRHFQENVAGVFEHDRGQAEDGECRARHPLPVGAADQQIGVHAAEEGEPVYDRPRHRVPGPERPHRQPFHHVEDRGPDDDTERRILNVVAGRIPARVGGRLRDVGDGVPHEHAGHHVPGLVAVAERLAERGEDGVQHRQGREHGRRRPGRDEELAAGECESQRLPSGRVTAARVRIRIRSVTFESVEHAAAEPLIRRRPRIRERCRREVVSGEVLRTPPACSRSGRHTTTCFHRPPAYRQMNSTPRT